jgi:Short C-terminal domain
VTVYDTQDHQISGFSQQQPGSGSLSFSSQVGGVDVSRLPVVSGASGMRPAELHARGVLTEAEFSSKKAELLGRL